MKKKSLPLSEVYRLLEPGPVVLLATHHKGVENVMTMSWHTMLDFEPPLIGCVVSNRDYTFDLLKASKACSINIPTAEFLKMVVGCGNTTGSQIDKFKKFKMTKMEASQIKAPLIDECFANLECIVVDSKMVAKYNFFVLEVVKSWIDPVMSNFSKTKTLETLHHRGEGIFMIAGREIKSRSKMK
ncbi:MAG: flavin reductase family protein [Bacteriovorax sp.]